MVGNLGQKQWDGLLLNLTASQCARLDCVFVEAKYLSPWGNPYQYLVVEGLGNNGAVRKDKKLVPVNRHYDVYSMGKDGVTASPFTSTLGRDDVVLAGDGSYFGLAEDF